MVLRAKLSDRVLSTTILPATMVVGRCWRCELLPNSACAQTCQSGGRHGGFGPKRARSCGEALFRDVGARRHGGPASRTPFLVAANFAGIEAAVKENKVAFTGAKATVRPPFLLTADSAEPLARAEFLCGVFGRRVRRKIARCLS